MDLMSAERINREVATWLAAWRRYMAAEAGEQLPGGLKAKKAAAAPPEHQLLLLCGAPGKPCNWLQSMCRCVCMQVVTAAKCSSQPWLAMQTSVEAWSVWMAAHAVPRQQSS